MLLFQLRVARSSATATPGSAVIPTSTPLPTAESAPVVVGLENMQVDAYAELEGLLDELEPRESATSYEPDSASCLEEKFMSFGWATEIQTFPVIGKELAGMGLTLTTPARREFVGLPIAGSGLGDVSGILVPRGPSNAR